jgi:hypothetical protein
MEMIRTMLFAIATVTSFSASAQMPNFGKSGGSSGGVTAEQLVKDYVAADKDVIGAQSRLALALGLKEHAQKLEVASDSLKEGATKDGLNDTAKVQGEAGKAVDEALKTSNGKLDTASKAKYTEGLALLGRGVIKYVAMKSTISGYKPSVTSLGASANAASFVVSTAPQQMTTLGGTLSRAIDFAKANDIPIPADATSALSGLK